MSDSQLRRDLANRLEERLRQWARDGVALYDMAGLPKQAVGEDLFSTLLFFQVEAIVRMEIDPDSVFECMAEAINAYARYQKEKKQKDTP